MMMCAHSEGGGRASCASSRTRQKEGSLPVWGCRRWLAHSNRQRAPRQTRVPRRTLKSLVRPLPSASSLTTLQQLETVQELLLIATNKIDEHKAHQDLNPDLQQSGSPDSEAKLPLEEKVNIVRRERRASMTSMEIDTAIPTPVHPSRCAEAKASTLDVSGRFQTLKVPGFCFTARCVLWTAVWDSFQLGCKHIGMAVLLALPSLCTASEPLPRMADAANMPPRIAVPATRRGQRRQGGGGGGGGGGGCVGWRGGGR
eukprot:3937930-Rhodomonas_salina.1